MHARNQSTTDASNGLRFSVEVTAEEKDILLLDSEKDEPLFFANTFTGGITEAILVLALLLSGPINQ